MDSFKKAIVATGLGNSDATLLQHVAQVAKAFGSLEVTLAHFRSKVELPDELAIDTNAARRIIGEFIRAQLDQAGFSKALLGLSGGIDSALVAYLTAEAIGPENVGYFMRIGYYRSGPLWQDSVRELPWRQHGTFNVKMGVYKAGNHV